MTTQLRDLQARFLRYFTALYETRSITQAAEKLFITQPALSNSIRTLEKQLAMTLFDRTPQGIAPTVYADALYRRAKMAEAELHLAVVEMEQLRDAEIGSVRFGLGPSMFGICASLLPVIVAAKPKLDISVFEGTARVLMDQLSTGRLDFVICTMPDDVSYPELDLRFLRNLPTVAVARRDHPLAGRTVKRGDLSAYPWIIADSALESAPNDLMRLFIDRLPQTIVSTNSASVMRMTIAGGDFIGFMPHVILAHDHSARNLAALDLAGGIYERQLYVVTRKGSMLPPSSALLLAEFERAIAGEHT